MKGKIGYLIAGIILFLAGVLVGELMGGGLGEKDVKLSTGQSLDAKLEQIQGKLAGIFNEDTKEYTFNLDGTPMLGNGNAKVKIVVWSDFLCPYCKTMEKALEELVKNNPGKYALYMKDKLVHPTAALEHEAGQAANAQGKYWEFASLLFENQGQITQLSSGDQAAYQARLVELAQTVGINVDQFKADLESHKYKPVLDKEEQESQQVKISSTPSIFINGRRYSGDADAIKKKAEELLAAGGKLTGKAGLESRLNDIEDKVAKLVEYFEKQRGPKIEQGKEYSFNLEGGPVIGSRNAKVKVVIFSDFQCPYCERMGQILEEFQAQNPGMAVFYKNFVVHPKAQLVHEAAMSASAQGKFKQMHDLLFKNRGDLTRLSQESEDKLKEKILELGKEAGLNVSRLKSDLEEGKYREQLAADQAEGKNVGVSATPSVFVNGFFHGYNPDDIKAKISEALKK